MKVGAKVTAVWGMVILWSWQAARSGKRLGRGPEAWGGLAGSCEVCRLRPRDTTEEVDAKE